MPPSRMPPNPGAGVTGRSRSPRATRRVGAMAREWKTSSSARITGAAYRWSEAPPGSHVGPQDRTQVTGRVPDGLAVDRVGPQQRGQAAHPLAHVGPLVPV